MKKIINIKNLILAALFMASLSSCLTDDGVEGITSPDGYPTATFAISSSSVTEDGSVIIKITTDKAINDAISFEAVQVGGTAVEHDDYDVENAVLAAWSTEANIVVHFYDDKVFEETETLTLQIVAPSLANKFLLNTNTVLPSFDINITNYVATSLDIHFDMDKDVTALSPDEMSDAASVSLSTDEAEFNFSTQEYEEGEIEFTSPDGFAVKAGVTMDFVSIVLPDNLVGLDGLLDYGAGTGIDEGVADFFENGNVLVAKTLYNTGTPATSATVVKGDLFVYKITRDTEVSYGFITVGDLALLNGTDPVLNLEYREGVLPEPETTSAYDYYISFDIYMTPVEDPDGVVFDINDPWASDYSSYLGDQDGSVSLDLTGADDGEYIIWHDLWWNAYHTILEDAEADGSLVPITTSFTRDGSAFTQDVVQDASQSCPSDQMASWDYDFDPAFGDFRYGGWYTDYWHNGILAKITVADGTFTITDFDDIVIATGTKSKAERAPRPLKFMKNKPKK